MSRYQLIAFDMDDTLLNSRKEILPGSVAAIDRAVAAGKSVAICSGRCYAELEPFAKLLPGVRYFVGLNGAAGYDVWENRTLFEQPIPPETVDKLFDISDEIDSMVQMMSRATHVQLERQKRIREYHAEVYEKLFYDYGVFHENLRAYYEKERPAVYKFTPYTRTVEGLHEMLPRLNALGVSTARAVLTGVECTAAGVDKGSGLRRLLDVLDIPAENMIAIGDADNDLSMLRLAGLGIAVGNANENVRAIADVIVADNDHGGPAEAIEKYLLAE